MVYFPFFLEIKRRLLFENHTEGCLTGKRLFQTITRLSSDIIINYNRRYAEVGFLGFLDTHIIGRGDGRLLARQCLMLYVRLL